MAEMELTVPAVIAKGQPFTAHVEQKPSVSELSAAGAQYSPGPIDQEPEDEWPWVTAPAPGEEVPFPPVEAAPVPYDSEDESWDYPGIRVNSKIWLRVGAWTDEDLDGDPVEVSQAIQVTPKEIVPDLE